MEEDHIIAAQKAMNEVGVSVLRVELYGHGKSDGAFRDHTLYKWVQNAISVVKYAKDLDFVTDLYLCGHSQGGLTVMLAAAMKQDVVKGLIPMSPAAMIPESARRGELLGVHFDPDHIPDELPAWNNGPLSGNYVRVAQTIRVEDAIDRYQGPVLLVHGDNDGAVPVQCSIDAAARYANAQLTIIKGDDHCYGFHLEKVTAAVQKWIRARIEEDEKNA
jgi:pimeloyl-ACP methyl ester carboxylesterase